MNEIWPKVRLGDVCEVKAGRDYKDVESPDGKYPIYGTGGVMGMSREWRCPAGSVIVGRKGTLDNPMLINEPFWNIDTCFGVVPSGKLLPAYLWRFCQNFDFYSLVPASGRPSTTSDAVKAIKLPLPPLAEQKKIVEKVEKALRRVEALKAQFERMEKSAADYFKAALAETFAAVKGEKVKLGDVCETGAGGTPLKQNRAYYDGGTIPWLRSGEVCRKDITGTEMFITRLGMDCSSAKLFPVGSVLVAMYGATAGQVGILRISAATNQAVCAILPTDKIVPEFLYYQLLGLKAEMVSQAQGGAQPNISQEKVRGLLIFVPQMDVQQQVVSALDAAKSKSERMVVAARRCVEICGKMRKAILAEAFQ